VAHRSRGGGRCGVRPVRLFQRRSGDPAMALSQRAVSHRGARECGGHRHRLLAHRHHRGHLRHAAVLGCVRRGADDARGGGARASRARAVVLHGARDARQVACGDELARGRRRRAPGGL
jgi:Sugar (and other) transporter.